MNLLYDIERGTSHPPAAVDALLFAALMQRLATASLTQRARVLCVLADTAGFSLRDIRRSAQGRRHGRALCQAATRLPGRR
jgi:hypothetical protein